MAMRNVLRIADYEREEEMKMTNDRSQTHRGASAPRGATHGRDNRLCNLQCKVPVEARRRARIAAIESGLPFRIYVAQILLQAKPMNTEQAGTTDARQPVPREAQTRAEPAMERVSGGESDPVSVENGDHAKDDAATAAEQDAIHEERSET